ncbi:Neprilysin-4 [Mortierella alpina]|nr:Neprilysin-4 [Mortierella alpina]
MDPNVATPADPPIADVNDLVAQENLRKIHDLYASCMDETQLANLGRDPLLKQIEDLLRIFPAPDSAFVTSVAANRQGSSHQPSFNKTALARALGYFNRLGLSSMNQISVTTDLSDPSKRVLLLSEGGLALSKLWYRSPMALVWYEYTVGNMLHLIMEDHSHDNSSTPAAGTNATTLAVPKRWRDVATNVVDFELQLLEAGTAASFWTNPANIHTPLSLEGLSALTPSIDWPEVLNTTLPLGAVNTRPVSVLSTVYQERLEALLQKTNSKTLQNYFVWQIIWRLSSKLAPQYHQPIRDFYYMVYDIPENDGGMRWEICANVVNEQLGQMLGYYFIQDHYVGDSRSKVAHMIESLQSTFRGNLNTSHWLDNSTRMAALEKIEALTAVVGFSTESPNVESALSLQQHYAGYQVQSQEFFQNTVRYGSWRARRNYQSLNETVNLNSSDLPPQTVSAVYDLAANRIRLPAGILQPPFFHPDYPEYILYGGIGGIVSHEIAHGFGALGRYFDKTGRKTNWWTNATERAFAVKAKCFVDQYSQYQVKVDDQAYNVSGEDTRRENIADSSGLRLAYKTWKTRYNTDQEYNRNFKLFGLEDYTAEKLFFISYARLWCGKQRPMQLYKEVLTGKHSPDQWRINGVLQNSPAFANAFNCSLGSPMNPQKKCELW